MSWQLRLIDGYLRAVERPGLARATEVGPVREGLERSARRVFRAPPHALFRPDRLGGRPFLWAHGRPRRPGLLLWFHGGIYIMGSPRTHRGMVAGLAMSAGCRAGLPAYRLAPEHPFPAAFDDAVAAWRGLSARGYPARGIVLGGDSAGGGLALALLAHILTTGGARPAGLIAFSPLTDVEQTGASMIANAGRDALLPARPRADPLGWYLAGADPRDPRAAPLCADFPDPPPVFLQAAETELLRDDTLRMADRLRAAGGEVTLDMWRDTPHVWPIFRGWLPEADIAIARAGAWLAATLDQAAVSTR